MEELKFLRGTKASYDNLANVDANAVYIASSGETASEIHIDGVTWSSDEIIFGEIIKNEKVVATSLQNIKDSVGLNENLKFEEFTDTNYLNGIKDIKECLVELDNALKNLTPTIETRKMYHKVTSNDAWISLAPFSSFKINGVEQIGSGEDHVTLKPSETEYEIEYVFKKDYRELTDNALGGESLVRISPNGLDGIVSIGPAAFASCSNLEEITIPMSVSHIGNYAFNECSSLTSIDIPNSVGSIGEGAFTTCTSLTSVTMGDSVTSIGYAAFGACTSLVSIKLSSTLTSISSMAFIYCASLQEITIPQSVINIGDGAFGNCIILPSIEIPNSVIYIGSSAFFNCDGFDNIEIPISVINIGLSAFTDSTIRSVKYNGVTYTSKSALINALTSNGVIVQSNAFDRTDLLA